MKWPRVCLVGVAICLLLLGWLNPSVSQEKKKPPVRSKADANNLIKELMSLKFASEQSSLGVWMPFEAFVELGVKDDGSNREAVEEELDFLKKYQVIVCGMSKEERDGTKLYANQKELEAAVTLKLATGGEFPLAEKVPPKVSDMVESFRRNFAANQGEFGKNTYVLIFSSTSKDGKAVLNAGGRNTLILDFKESKRYQAVRMEWRTPFDSLNPVPPCTRCEEPISVKWAYCPWCGAKITRR